MESTILPVLRMQRMSRDSPEATSHVSCSPMKPCPQFVRVASIDFHTLQPSEWMGATGGGQWGWRWRFRPCFWLAQELWVHVLWILKISSSSIPGTKNSLTLVYPCRWHCLCTGQVIIRDRKSYKGGIQLWMFQWFFGGYALDICHGTGKKTEETCANLR